jgi:hypothetical protein
VDGGRGTAHINGKGIDIWSAKGTSTVRFVKRGTFGEGRLCLLRLTLTRFVASGVERPLVVLLLLLLPDLVLSSVAKYPDESLRAFSRRIEAGRTSA